MNHDSDNYFTESHLDMINKKYCVFNMKNFKLNFFILGFIFCWIKPSLADAIVDQYLTSDWLKIEAHPEISKKYDGRKYSTLDLYKYSNSELYTLVSHSTLQHSRYLRGFCYSEIRMSYFYGKNFDEVNFQHHNLGWIFYGSDTSSGRSSCGEKALNGKKISIVGELSFGEAIYIIDNFKKISKKVSSRDIDCEGKEIQLIFSDGLGDVELLLADADGKNFSLLLERANEKLKPIECTEIAD